jgi:precorrin-2 dehydrogenase/sirohydrochlorin ferrochelatase
MQNLPVFLTVRDRPCVVVGGGPVGTRKARALADAGARVTVVTPACTGELEAMAGDGSVRLVRRAYRTGDLEGAWLAYVATGVPEIQDRVAADAEQSRVWLNAVDEPERCSFITPAVVERGRVSIAIGTGGASPALSGAIRRDLDAWLGDEYEHAARLLADLRERHEPGEARQRAFMALLGAGLLEALRDGDARRVDGLVRDAFADVPRRESAPARAAG